MSSIRLMSHNQWYCDQNLPEWEQQGIDCSATVRMRGFVKVFQDIQPDIVGCQEVSPTMADKLIRYLAEDGMRYALLWGRDTPILYRPDKFELIDSEFFLYSEDVPGYEGSFNNGKTKSYCLAVFRVKETGKIFIFTTTHLWYKKDDPDHRQYQYGSTPARVYQIGLCIAKIDEFQKKYNCPAVLVGDLNARYETPVLQRAFDAGFVHAHNIAVEYADETNGHHYCGPKGVEPYVNTGFLDAIDHILVRNAPDGFIRRFDRYITQEYLPLSDHHPAFVDVEY